MTKTGAVGNNRGNIPSTVADRVAFQADKTELSLEILLRRKRQCHQNPDLGHAHCEPAAFGLTKNLAKALELLGAGNNR